MGSWQHQGIPPAALSSGRSPQRVGFDESVLLPVLGGWGCLRLFSRRLLQNEKDALQRLLCSEPPSMLYWKRDWDSSIQEFESCQLEYVEKEFQGSYSRARIHRYLVPTLVASVGRGLLWGGIWCCCQGLAIAMRRRSEMGPSLCASSLACPLASLVALWHPQWP